MACVMLLSLVCSAQGGWGASEKLYVVVAASAPEETKNGMFFWCPIVFLPVLGIVWSVTGISCHITLTCA